MYSEIYHYKNYFVCRWAPEKLFKPKRGAICLGGVVVYDTNKRETTENNGTGFYLVATDPKQPDRYTPMSAFGEKSAWISRAALEKEGWLPADMPKSLATY